MGIRLKIGAQNTEQSIEFEENTLFSFEYQSRSINEVARSNEMEYILTIHGKIQTYLNPVFDQLVQNNVLEINNWANTPYTPDNDYYRNVSITYVQMEQVVRELNFTRAYVIQYLERFDIQEGIGSFKLILGQKRDIFKEINFGKKLHESDRENVLNTPVLNSRLISFQPIKKNKNDMDAIAEKIPQRKDVIKEKFEKNLDTQPDMSGIKGYREAVVKRFLSGTPIAQNVYLRYVKEKSIKTGSSDSSFYRDSEKKVYMDYSGDLTLKGKGVVFFHEFGHYIDYTAGKLSNDETFKGNLRSDFKNYMESYANKVFQSEIPESLKPHLEKIKIELNDIMNPDYWNGKRTPLIDFEKMYADLSRELKPDGLSAVSDLYSGLSIIEVEKSVKRIEGKWQHKVEYWKEDPEKVYREAFAHFYEAQFDAKRRENVRRYFPTAYKRFETLLGSL